MNAALIFMGMDETNLEELHQGITSAQSTPNTTKTQKRKNNLLQKKRDKLKQVEEFFDRRVADATA